MIAYKTPLKDCYVIESTVLEDERGFFIEKYNEKNLKNLLE